MNLHFSCSTDVSPASMCDDPVIQSAIKKWCNNVMKKNKSRSFKKFNETGIQLNLKIQQGYNAFLHATDVEVCMGRTSIGRKIKVSPFYMCKVWSEEVENEVNVWALKDINRVIEMKSYFYFHKFKFDMNEKTYYDWVSTMNQHGNGFSSYHLPSFEEIKIGLGVDYAFRSNPKRIKLVDERERVCISNVLYNNIGMTSGFVGDKTVYDTRKTTPSSRHCCSSRPVILKFSTVPAFEEKLEESKRNYLKRKELLKNKFVDVVFIPSLSSTSVFVEELSKKERSISESSEEIEEEKKCCHEDLKFGMRDQQMIHHSMCEMMELDLYDSEATLRDAERLWFINKFPELSMEYTWLDAKVRRSMTDFYNFDSCRWCEEEYTVLNYMKMRSNAYKFHRHSEVSQKIVDLMSRFCSYYCFNSMVLGEASYFRDQELRLTNLERTFCAFCNKSTFSYNEKENTWRKVEFFAHKGGSEILAFCSDECFIYFDRRHNDRKILTKLSGQCIAFFSFFTCLHCSKILLPSEKVIHFRNFPRIPWAFCCYDDDCVSSVLKISIPTNPLFDNYFMSPSVPVPFDRIDGLEPHEPQVQATLRALKVKEMSSCSGGRFILTILE